MDVTVSGIVMEVRCVVSDGVSHASLAGMVSMPDSKISSVRFSAPPRGP